MNDGQSPLVNGKAWLSAVLAFVLVGIGVEYSARLALDDAIRDNRNHVMSEAGNIRARVESELNATLHLSTGLAVYLSSYGDSLDPAALWEMMAQIHKHGRFFKNITVAPGTTIRYIYPVTGNESALGLDYRKLPQQWPLVEKAIETRAAVIYAPVVLVQGERALVYRNPVFKLDGHYWGMVSILIKIDELLAATGLQSNANNVDYALVTDMGSLFGNPDLLANDAVTLPVEIPSGHWSLLARPVGGWMAQTHVANHIRKVGFALALPFAVLSFFLALYQDRRRAMEGMARRHEQHLRAAQHIAHLGSWEHNPMSQSLFLSDEMRQLFQWSNHARMTITDFTARIHPDDVEHVKQSRRDLTTDDAHSDVTFRVVLADGKTRTMHERCSVAVDPKTGARLIEGVVRDVTEDRETEQILRRAMQDAELAREHLQRLIDQSPLPMLVSEGIDQRVVLLNRKFRNVIGYTRDDIPDVEHWWPLAYPDPEYRSQIINTWEQRIATAMRLKSGIQPVEAVIRCKNGTERVFVVHANSLDERNLVVFVDVTDLRAVEQQLRDTKTQADEASRAKSEFVANMSHEIRTPLNAVLGLARLLSYTSLDHHQKQYVSQIESSGKVLLGTINDILDFSKIEAGKLELEKTDFDLDEVLREIRSIAQIDARAKNLSLAFDVAKDIPRELRGDPFRLQQVLLNLLSNAIKFTERGLVTLTVRDHSNGGTIRLLFQVRDTGIGIAPEQLKKLFAAFTQADTSTTRRFGGTGLGLVISNRIANMMGGELAVEGNDGGGSTFSFTATFARALQPIHGADYKPVTVAADALVGWRLLLVEDNLANQLVATELLKQFGAIVDVANNGVQALEKIRLGFDAVIMDIQMPEMDGYEATRRIRAIPKYTDIPIIAMTANVMADDVRACLYAGMNDHIAKPIDVPEMVRILRRWLDGRERVQSV